MSGLDISTSRSRFLVATTWFFSSSAILKVNSSREWCVAELPECHGAYTQAFCVYGPSGIYASVFRKTVRPNKRNAGGDTISTEARLGGALEESDHDL